MTAIPDDAAASSVPPRADRGPAAPSSSGTTGPRIPEDSLMPQQPPAHGDTVHDETVRMRADGPDGRAPLDTAPPVHGGLWPASDEVDDTRPVTRDWLLGSPGAPAEPGSPPATEVPPSPAQADDDYTTQAFGMSGPPAPPAADGEAEAAARPITEDAG